MSRNIHEPSLYRQVSANRAHIKTTHQKPEAFRWVTPVDMGESIPATEPDYTPEFTADFFQPSGASGLERFSFRLNADGRFQTKGFIDVSSAVSGDIAWIMPGSTAGEMDFIPPTDDNDGFTLRVTTTGALAGVTNATAHIDSSTGEVTIVWSSGGGDTHVWAALSTETAGGWQYEGAGADDTVDWSDVWISDSANGVYFDYECVSSGGQFGDDIAFLTILQSGIYTFTHQFHSNSLDGPSGSNEAFHYQTRLNVCGGTPGTSWGSNSNVFPGQVGTVALLQDREQLWIGDNSGDDLWLNRSWTIPLDHPNPGTERRCGEMRMFHDPQSSDPFWTVRLWIVRHGDLDWAASQLGDNPTWESGDPC